MLINNFHQKILNRTQNIDSKKFQLFLLGFGLITGHGWLSAEIGDLMPRFLVFYKLKT